MINFLLNELHFKSSAIFLSCVDATQYHIFYKQKKFLIHCPFTCAHKLFSCFGCLRLQTHTYLSRTVLSGKMFRKGQNSTSAELTVFSKCTLEYCKCLEENDIHAVLHDLLTWVTFPTHHIERFLISNFRRVLIPVCFLLGNSPASEFYMPTFRNILSVPSS